FQAEDGIRDKLVTGVQTCALPIYHAFGARLQQVGLLVRRRVWRSEYARSFLPIPVVGFVLTGFPVSSNSRKFPSSICPRAHLPFLRQRRAAASAALERLTSFGARSERFAPHARNHHHSPCSADSSRAPFQDACIAAGR